MNNINKLCKLSQYCGVNILWPVLYPHYDHSYDRNPNKLDHFDPKNFSIFGNFSIFERNDLAYLDYDRNAVIVLATGRKYFVGQLFIENLQDAGLMYQDYFKVGSCDN